MKLCKCGSPNDSKGQWACRRCRASYLRKRRAKGIKDDKRRNHRNGKGDSQCSCKAYRYPHRRFGGKCRPQKWVERFFEPHKKECRACHNLVNHQCQVALQVETTWHCPALRERVTHNWIKLYGAAKREYDRMTKSAHL